MPDDLGQPKLGKHGGARPGAGRPTKGEERNNQGNNDGDVVTLNPRGNRRAYILARLEREGLTDWIQAIRTRRISAFAVACQLGWARRPPTLSQGNCDQSRKRRFDIAALIG